MKTISDHILDIVQNSIAARATLIEIIVEESKKNDLCFLSIKDNGCGMNEEMVKQACNPFFTTRKTRKVGLGLALLKQNSERANGKFSLSSVVNKGTELRATFQYSNVDRPELGDVWDTYYLTMLSNENIDFVFEFRTDKGGFKIQSAEIKEMIDGVPLKQKEIRNAIVELIKNNIKEIQ
jgi:hypothetical protein